MAFRKRNVAVGRTAAPGSRVKDGTEAHILGVRPSPVTSHSVTSAGVESLDDLLGGHAGLALGSSLLVEESGATDFTGALLRFYAAEGICQRHVIHVVGMDEGWLRDLPGLADEKRSRNSTMSASDDEKMKIAWRYQKLGQAEERANPDRSSPKQEMAELLHQPFCHTFDLTKRLAVPQDAKVNFIPVGTSANPFTNVLKRLVQEIKGSPQNSIHRLVVPSILSPASWPSNASRPEHFLGFLHALRSLMSQNYSRLTAILSLPLEIYPRNSGLARWAEILSDGVLELTPFEHSMDISNTLARSGGARGSEDHPQGMLKVHKLPINSERGEGGAGAGNSMGEDLAFIVSRKKFVIKPFSLPPLEGDQESQSDTAKFPERDVEF